MPVHVKSWISFALLGIASNALFILKMLNMQALLFPSESLSSEQES